MNREMVGFGLAAAGGVVAVGCLLPVYLISLFQGLYRARVDRSLGEWWRAGLILMIWFFAMGLVAIEQYVIGVALLAIEGIAFRLLAHRDIPCPRCGGITSPNWQGADLFRWRITARGWSCRECEFRLVGKKWPWEVTRTCVLLCLICAALYSAEILPAIVADVIVWPCAILTVVGMIADKFVAKL